MKFHSLIVLVAMAIVLPSLKAANDASVKPYPLEICFVSGEKLGDMGKPIVTVYEGQEIKFCCKSCQKQFDKDPAAAMVKFNEAVKAAEK